MITRCIWVLTFACVHIPQESWLLRVVIAGSAAITLLYTPYLKHLCVVKNASVALVIAASPIAGALAAGAVRLPSLLQPHRAFPSHLT